MPANIPPLPPLPEGRTASDASGSLLAGFDLAVDELNARIRERGRQINEGRPLLRRLGRRMMVAVSRDEFGYDGLVSREEERALIKSANEVAFATPLLAQAREDTAGLIDNSRTRNAELLPGPVIGSQLIIGNPLESRPIPGRANRLRVRRISATQLAGVMNNAVADVPLDDEEARELQGSTQAPGETHRFLAPVLARTMQGAYRRPFMRALDQAVEDDTRQAVANGEVVTDVVVVGSGVEGAIFAAQLREAFDSLDVTILNAGRTGGQFRSYGNRPVFSVNSRTRRSTGLAGVPGNNGNLNRLGRRAPLQIDDFVSTTYPNNLDIGDTTAINAFLSADRTLHYVRAEEAKKRGRNDSYETLMARDERTGKKLLIKAGVIVYFTGLGEASSRFGMAERILTGPDLYREFGNEQNVRPMRKYNGSTTIIAGCGDTAKTNFELYCRLMSDMAYGDSRTQLDPGPERLIWVQDQFRTRSEFAALVRARYSQLASFIGDGITNGQIVPVLARAQSVRTTRSAVTVRTSRGNDIRGDYFIDDTGIADTRASSFGGFTLASTELVTVGKEDRTVGRRVPGRNIFIGGPSAQLPLDDRYVLNGNKVMNTVPENTAAIWSYEQATSKLAEIIALKFGQMPRSR